jgi:hypothetical protein
MSSKPGKKRRSKQSESTIPSKKKIEGNLVVVENDEDKSPPLPGFNLAGRPDYLKHKEGGLKKNQVKTSGPYHSGNINTESYWHFVIRSNKNEWIRFNPDSISVLLYGSYNNPSKDPASRDPAKLADKHALMAGVGAPFMYLDPSVMGTSFVYRVDVSINNTPVPTNSFVGNLLLQYVRCSRVFNHQAKNFFALSSDIASSNTRSGLNSAMKKGVAAFDYFDPLSDKGARVPVYLDGIFPFSRKNSTSESVDRKKEQNLYFPPDTTVEIKLHVYRTKTEAIFHHQLNLSDYFSTTVTTVTAPNTDITLTFQDVILEYEAVELKASEHVKAMKQYLAGGMGTYNYDIIRGQHQTLEGGQSATQTVFQISEYARIIYILYIPDWATFPMESTRKPLSGLTRFPLNATSISIGFAGEQNLITERFENFGIMNANHEISKKIYYNYLRKNRMINCNYEQLFPREKGIYSLIQGFVLDVQDSMSDKIELLTIQHEFANTSTSPVKHQVICLSVHPNGKATCRSGSTQYEWIWEFSTLN